MSFSLYSQSSTEIELVLDSGKKTLHCFSKLISTGTHFFCQNGEETILIIKEGSNVSAITSHDGEFQRAQVLKIKNEAITYSAQEDEKFAFKQDNQKTYNDLIQTRLELSKIANYPFAEDKTDLINLKNKLLGNIQKFQDKVKKDFDEHSSLKLTTSQGHDINCQRGNPKTCLLYHCEPIVINGKSYQVQFNNSTLETSLKKPAIILANEEGLGPSVQVKEIVMNDSLFFDNKTLRAPLFAGFTKKDNFKDYTERLPKPFKGNLVELQDKEETYNLLDDSYQKTLKSYDLKQCDDEKITQLENLIQKQYHKLSDLLAQKKLVELIQYSENKLNRELILATEVTPNMCHMGGDVWALDKETQRKLKDSLVGLTSGGNKISSESLTKIFKFAQDQDDIPWEHYQDGCYARAHVLSKKIEETFGVGTEKIWAFGQLSPEHDPSITWSYHVATKINVEENGKTEVYVLDPSVSKVALKENDWLKKINPKKINIAKTSWPAPIETGIVRQVSVSYSPSSVYFYKDDKITEEKMEKNLNDAQKENLHYQKVLNAK